MPGRLDFADWAREHTTPLFRRALILTGDWHQAEDLVQETLTRVYGRWKRIDLDQNVAGYAMRTLFHVFISDRRSRRGEVGLSDVVPDRQESGRDHEIRMDLARVLARLSPQERFVLVARYLDDLSVEEVATMLNRTRSWVRTTAHRATRRIQRTAGPLASLLS
jgi:RNA polymerase sigma factor (sigma-70 family)